jgi:hypothetical protein
VRGYLLSIWEPAGDVAPEARSAWLVAADRIATGIAELAHLDAFVDATHWQVGFSCDGDEARATSYEAAILRENVEARGCELRGSRDQVIVPCSPTATNEEITHVVLAVMKASHAIDFEVVTEPLSS